MASSACWEVLEVLEEGQVQTEPQTALPLLGTPAEMARPPRLELPPILETVDLPMPEGSEQANSRRQEDLAVQVGSLISEPLVHCVSSLNPWQDRSPGSCPSRSWEPSPSPGNDDHAGKATASSNRCCCGACGCSPWASSLASRPSFTSITLR